MGLGRSVWRCGEEWFLWAKERIRDLHSTHVNSCHHPLPLESHPLKLINLLLVFFFLAYVILERVQCVLCPEGLQGRSSPAAVLYDDTNSWHWPAVIHTPEPTVSPDTQMTFNSCGFILPLQAIRLLRELQSWTHAVWALPPNLEHQDQKMLGNGWARGPSRWAGCEKVMTTTWPGRHPQIPGQDHLGSWKK